MEFKLNFVWAYKRMKESSKVLIQEQNIET